MSSCLAKYCVLNFREHSHQVGGRQFVPVLWSEVLSKLASLRETDGIDDMFGAFINDLFKIQDDTLPHPRYKSLYEKKGHSLIVHRTIVISGEVPEIGPRRIRRDPSRKR